MNPSKAKTKPILTEGPIAKTLLIFFWPILLGNVLQSLNGSINSIWVGKFLGEQALAANGQCEFDGKFGKLLFVRRDYPRISRLQS
jgi:hypothetical protein